MNLNNPDTRRALRNVLLCIIVLTLLYFSYDALSRLKQEKSVLEIARDCLIIIGLFVLGVITENVGRVSVDIASIKASMGDTPPEGGQ
jgi:Na+-driven multidrug efflux pump